MFTSYDKHYQIRLLDEICWKYRWLEFRSWLIYPHLPQRVLRQFGYLQSILSDPIFDAPPTMYCRDVDEIFTAYHEHLILEDVQSVPTYSPWCNAYSYIKWYYRVSNSYMMTPLDENPPRSTHQKIIQENMLGKTILRMCCLDVVIWSLYYMALLIQGCFINAPLHRTQYKNYYQGNKVHFNI